MQEDHRHALLTLGAGIKRGRKLEPVPGHQLQPSHFHRGGKPLLPARWAGAIDTVGRKVLATVLKEVAHRGCVATCGNVAGVELPLTVFPFILRGVKLDGIDSAMCPRAERLAIWKRLASEWLPSGLGGFATDVALSDVTTSVEEILHGQITGRIVVDLQG